MNKFEEKYFLNPKCCINCKNVLEYKKRYNKFCDSSCAATFNNLNSSPQRKRGPDPKINLPNKKERQRESARLKRWTINISGPYSKIVISKCSVCSSISLGPKWKKYCQSHTKNYSHAQRAKYWFTFKLSDYSNLFDFSLLKKYGMRSSNNLNGVVRDHKVSVADAIKHNYDPYYIKHPLNCELMLHSENSKKRSKSSITYEELKSLVDAYEYGSPNKNRTCDYTLPKC